jgi:signal transduction histidine kinase
VWLGETLAALVRAAGASGAYLELDAAPLPPFEVGFGTIRQRPPEDPGRDDISHHELRADDGRVRLGSLWLAGAPQGGGLAPRALELALEGAWARAVVAQTASQLAALDQATQAIAGVLDVDDVLQLIVDRVRTLVGARYAALGIVGQNGRIETFITGGVTAAERAAIGPLPRGHGLLGLLIREGRSIRAPDISRHPASSGFPPNHPPMTSFLGVPVTARGRPIGNLYLTDKEDGREFTDGDQRLVEMFALHAGIAIESARLHEQAGRLAVVEERDRIGREIHDGIIQSLYAVSLSLEDMPEILRESRDEAEARIDAAIESLHLAIRELRNFIYGLRPETLDGSNVPAGIVALAQEFSRNTLVETEIDIDRSAAAFLAPDHGAHLLQLVREALSNAARHARPSHARVALRRLDGRSELEIADDGVGFDTTTVIEPGHHGLANMRARVDAIGGSLRIDSQPGTGTRIIVTLSDPTRSDTPAP